MDLIPNDFLPKFTDVPPNLTVCREVARHPDGRIFELLLGFERARTSEENAEIEIYLRKSTWQLMERVRLGGPMDDISAFIRQIGSANLTLDQMK